MLGVVGWSNERESSCLNIDDVLVELVLGLVLGLESKEGIFRKP